MSAFNGAFPGAPGAVSGMAASAVGFVLDVPADPTWEPIQGTDTLDKDGYYCVQIMGEKARQDPDKKAGVFFSFRIVDEDAAGKIISKFLPDPRGSKGDTWWLWRTLQRSIYGTTEAGKTAFKYVVGQYNGAHAYVRTGAYSDDNAIRTGVDSMVTRAEWEEAKAAGGTRFRWDAKVKAAGAAPVGALPGGLPASFPGSHGGLPGAPSAPTGFPGTVPAPTGAPMQQAAPVGFPTPPAQAAPAFPPAPPAAAPVAAPVGGSPFGFPPPPAAPAGAAPTTPQPTTQGFLAFPPGPQS